MRVLSEKSFNADNNADFKYPKAAFFKTKYPCKVEGTDFLPGGSRFINGRNGLLLNVYEGSNIVAKEGKWPVIDAHFKYVFEDLEVLEHWLDYWAHLVQHPRNKIRHLLLLSGGQGIGKSFFGKLLGFIFGEWNVQVLKNDALKSNFNSELVNNQIVIIEELMAAGRMETYNSLKEPISEDFITCNKKFVPEHDARAPFAFLAFTNHLRPLNIEMDDRRIHFYRSPAVPKDDTYYRDLFRNVKSEAPAFLWYLLNRDVEHFSPDSRPPMTADKKALVENSLPPAKAKLSEYRRDKAKPFDRELFTLNDVQMALGRDGIFDRSAEDRNLTETLRELGASSLKRQVTINGQRIRFWTFDIGKWKDAECTKLQKEYEA